MAICGIDLGTTNSVIATMEAGRIEVIPNQEGKQITPSVVFFVPNSDEISDAVVGESALYQALTATERCCRGIKRNIGRDYKFLVGTKSYTPIEISAVILKKMKRDAEDYLGEKLTNVVITVPAHFEPKQREDTKKAGEMAGFNVLGLLSEPTAAAFDYASEKGEELAGKLILVYDLGGGTFDVTLMKVEESEKEGKKVLSFNVIEKDGASQLGGLDWDKRIAEFVAKDFESQHGKDPKSDRTTYDHLLITAQQAKEALTNLASTHVACTYDGINHTVNLTRDKFEEITQDLLAQTEQKASDLMQKVEAEKGITWDKIDVILLAGGATKMPQVPQLIKTLSNREPVKYKGVDLNVGRGAAYAASYFGKWTEDNGGKSPIPTTDITSHGIGVTIYDEKTDRDVNEILIPKGTPFGEEREQTFYTYEAGQKYLPIRINQGESADLSGPETFEIGRFTITGLPGGPAGEEVKVKLRFNPDGIIEGEGVHVPSSKNVPIRVELKNIAHKG